jgi:two-component system chemotaxis sensor kinase CheA
VADTSDKALGEFLSEGQEIVDGLNHNLLQMDEARTPQGVQFDPELVNECFRGVHSLKGLSGLFGFEQMTQVAHTLESLLDSMRLGRVAQTPEILDLLFEAVELFGQMIAAASSGKEIAAEKVMSYLARLDDAAGRDSDTGEQDALSCFDFPPNILSVLTEYEEHRLLENIKQGRTIFQLHAAFDLMSIDTGLEQLKDRVKTVGEVITYLPSADSIDDTTIQLDVLVGSMSQLPAIRRALQDDEIDIRRVKRTDEESEQQVEAPPTPTLPRTRGREPDLAPDPVPPDPTPDPVPTPDPAPVPAPVPDPVPAPDPVPDPDPTSHDDLGTIRSVSQTVRVDIRKLDSLMNAVSELNIVHGGLTTVLERLSQRFDLIDETRALTREVRQLERRLIDMQNGILEVRMVPLRQVFDKLSRVVRKVSRESGKEIRLEVSGADTELDKLIVEELSDPLMHIIRNAIDHGIEMPSIREAAGKPRVGTIRVGARQQGSRVLVTVSDDGSGIDPRRVADVAVNRGVVDQGAVADMTPSELQNLLFLPGMSTREVATELSGRGVGLDVVKTNIARLSGIIDLSSTRGEGTELTITLPITLAIIQALVIESAGRTYAIPLNSVLESLMITAAEIQTVEGREVYSLRNHTLVLSRLEHLFRLERPADKPRPHKMFVVVIGLAQHRLGLVVDDLVGERDVVIKPLGSTLADVPGIAGATELSHQETVLVLDVPGLVEETLLRPPAATEAA